MQNPQIAEDAIPGRRRHSQPGTETSRALQLLKKINRLDG